MLTPFISASNADVRALADLMIATTIGDVVTYEAMSKAIGVPINARRFLISKAIKVANREAGAVFNVVIGVGQRRLPVEQAHLLGQVARGRIRRTSHRASDMIGRSMEMANDIPADAKRRAYAELSTLGLLNHLSRDKVVAKVEAAERPIPVALMLRESLAQLSSGAS